MTRNVFYFYISVILTWITVSDAARLPSEGIVEGDFAAPNQFPYQATILRSGNKLLCSGGIIGSGYILTAAHCVIKEDGQFIGEPLSVVVGVDNIKARHTEGLTLPVKKIYVPMKYNVKYADSPADIAVLMLNQSMGVSTNPKLQKLKLPENLLETYAGQEANVAGFGFDWISVYRDPETQKLAEKGGINSFDLKFVKADVMDSKQCKDIYGINRKILKTHLCARAKQRHNSKDKPSGICTGDSGSPLVVDGKTVIGIVNTAPIGCNEFNAPAVYTRVTKYVDFIKMAKKDTPLDAMKVYRYD